MNEDVLQFNDDNVKPFVSDNDIKQIQPEILYAFDLLHSRRGPGNSFLGWLDLPSKMLGEESNTIKTIASEIRERAEAFVSIGIGGSYLGAKAVIEALAHHFAAELNTRLKIYFAGHQLSGSYLCDLLDVIQNKKIWLNVISKSGTTTETALAFRILKHHLEDTLGKNVARQQIIATTDKSNGALRKIATHEGYRTFIIPDDVGGRFSVLSAVGLLPIAVAGIDIDELLVGARNMAQLSQDSDVNKNPCLKYAAYRNLLYRKSKSIELLACFEPSLYFIGEWWKQLVSESEGKDGKGIFPTSVNFSTDLHSMGQLLQDGKRNVFETFLIVEQKKQTVMINEEDKDFDGLNYLSGKTMDFINQKAYEGTALAHTEGRIPNMTIQLPKLSAYWLGQLLYFFEKAVAVSGYVLGVNPFNQPGVDAYKNNMFKLLGKPGYE